MPTYRLIEVNNCLAVGRAREGPFFKRWGLQAGHKEVDCVSGKEIDVRNRLSRIRQQSTPNTKMTESLKYHPI